jgi:tetratricopeptide (TPR) repeat protein
MFQTKMSEFDTLNFLVSQIESKREENEVKKDNNKITICLNMIVKNESRIIKRLLESALPIIDTYCICDTGSSDNTIEIIKNFFDSHGITGEIYNEPFQNFGYNRSHALKKAEGKGTYVLLLDADMKLVIKPEFNKESLKAGSYQITQQGGTLVYYNTRLIRSDIGATCVGVTHEYYNIPPPHTTDKLNSLSIIDIGDGGAKADKFERDIRLLTKGLEEDPKNQRYMFYLANSYRDRGDSEGKREAIVWYKKRIEMGGWDEEIWNAYYHIGNCHYALKEFDQAIYTWLEAYNFRPTRAESIYKIVNHYRMYSKHTIALQFCLIGKSIKFPTNDLLFIEKPVYEYLFDYELSIIAYYTKYPINHTMITNLLALGYNYDNVMSNYSFYINTLKDISGCIIKNFSDKTEMIVKGKNNKFVSSSPCIIPFEDRYLMNLRYVNYKVGSKGEYTLENNDGIVITLNKWILLDKDLNVMKNGINEIESKFFEIGDQTHSFIGFEDVRMCPVKDNSGKTRIMYQGMVKNDEKNHFRIGVGQYDNKKSGLDCVVYDSPNNRRCEKNWALFEKDSELYAIYEYDPLTIIKFGNDNKVTIVSKDDDIPAILKQFRGSTCGVRVVGSDGNDELWFVVHIVSAVPNNVRRYYHAFVVLDYKTLKFKKMSHLFKFDNKQSIEYCLGLVVEKEKVLMSYSIHDSSSFVGTYDRKELCKKLGF